MADPGRDTDFDLDTALSAEIDGALDAYVADTGLDPAAVHARLSAPDAAARRDELATARAALGTEVPLDDVTRRRLLAGAAPAPAGDPVPHRDRSRGLRALAAAAVVLVVLGGVLLLTRTGDDDGSSSSGSSAGSAAAARPVSGDLGNLGTVSTAEISGLLRGTRPSGASAAGSTAAASPRSNADGAARSREAGAVPGPAQVASCVDAYSADGTVRFQGTGTYQGHPAVVLGVDTDTRTIAFVVAAGDCGQVLYSASR